MFDFLKKPQTLDDTVEVLLDHEHDAMRSFLFSPAFTGYSKMLRNRMRERRDAAMSSLLRGDNKALDQCTRMEEAKDILLELTNLKKDFENAEKK
jgi:hypothetical protein